MHQYLTQLAGYIWSEAPEELKRHASKHIYSRLDKLCEAKFDPEDDDDMVIGAGEEDQAWNPAFCPPPGPWFPSVVDPVENGYFEHFWDPDVPNEGAYDEGLTYTRPGGKSLKFISSYKKAKQLWNTKIIPVYKLGSNRRDPQLIRQAYYWLGRVAHLLQDATVPPHVHNVPHDPFSKFALAEVKPSASWRGGKVFESGIDPFEKWLGADVQRLLKYDGLQLRGREREYEYKYEELPNIAAQRDLAWNEIKPGATNLFRLFWYTAQKTQYFASGGTVLARKGNVRYRTADGKDRRFDPSLWKDERVVIVGDPVQITEESLPHVADALVPHALRAVAGLYRLFWDETHPIPRPLVISSLEISDDADRVLQDRVVVPAGTKLNAKFILENRGTKAEEARLLTVGGRLNGACPGAPPKCPDFGPSYDVPGGSLKPNEPVEYKGTFTVQEPGSYNFFATYERPDESWNTSIPALAGLTNSMTLIVGTVAPEPDDYLAKPPAPTPPKPYDYWGKLPSPSPPGTGKPPTYEPPDPGSTPPPEGGPVPFSMPEYLAEHGLVIQRLTLSTVKMYGVVHACQLTVLLQNARAESISANLHFVAYDGGGVGRGRAYVMASLLPKARGQYTSLVWETSPIPGGSLLPCAKIAKIELSPWATVVYTGPAGTVMILPGRVVHFDYRGEVPSQVETWRGRWQSSAGQEAGELRISLAVSGTKLFGAIAASGSSRFSVGSVSGELRENSAVVGAAFEQDYTAEFKGTVDPSGKSVSGSYVTRGPGGFRDEGTFSVARQ